jgi:hypothetical protein
MPFRFKFGQFAVLFDQVALALVNGNLHVHLPIFRGGVLPAALGGYFVTGDNTSIKPPMVSIPKESGVTSSNKISLRLPANIGLYSGAKGNYLIRVYIIMHRATKKFATIFLTKRVRVTATNHNYFINIFNG